MKVVIVTPAPSFSTSYVTSLVETLHHAQTFNVEIMFHTRSGSNINELRNIMAQDIYEHPGEKPDKIFWIDSDISWLVADFVKILSSPFRITCGAYMLNPDGDLSVATQHETTDRMLPYSIKDVANLKEYEQIFASGFGFICMDFDVLEEIGLGCFAPLALSEELDNTMPHFCMSEDTAFCMRAKRAKIPIMWDTEVLLGHEKSTVWFPSSCDESTRTVGLNTMRTVSGWHKVLNKEETNSGDKDK